MKAGAKTLALIFLALFGGIASAEASNIILEINNGQITATNVVDDDSSIERLDIFVSNPGGETLNYSYGAVVAGTIFSEVSFGEQSTVSYNFTDTDGTIIGLGVLKIIQEGDVTPPCTGDGCDPVPSINLVNGLDLNPRVAEGNSAYYVDVVLDLNSESTITRLISWYGLNDGSLIEWNGLSFDGRYYRGTLGPFNQKLKVRVVAHVFDDYAGASDGIGASEWFEILLPESNECNIAQVVSTAPAEKTIGNNELTASFEILSGFSYLEISKTESGALTAEDVVDNDGSIQRVDVFYQIGDNVSQLTFQNVREGQSLGSIPDADFSWFNYYDYDGSVSNISTLNQFTEIDDPVEPPPIVEGPDYLDQIDFRAVVSETGKSFELFAEANTGEDTPEEMRLKYRINGGNWIFTDLDWNGSMFTGSLGSFDDEFEITEGYLQASGEEGTDVMWGFTPRWYKLVLAEQLECTELCFDYIDNDGDGLVDEGCVLLGELFFLKKNVPYYALSNEPIKGDLTIKNSGVAGSASFILDIGMNGKTVASVPVSSIGENDSIKVPFSIPYKAEYEGTNEFTAMIDSQNDVAEMIETNNSYSQEIIVGPEFFRVTLNYNDTYFPGDYREIMVTDSYERPVSGASVKISTPSGENIALYTPSGGTIEFRLPESGTYSIAVTKEEFIPFEGKFAVAELVIAGLKDIVPAGESQELSIENTDKRKLTDGTFEVSLPQGTTLSYDLGAYPIVSFKAEQQGKYALRVVRNELVVYESEFLATGIVESVLLGPGSLLDLLFGSIIRTPLVFLFLIILAAASAYFAYSKSPMFFRKGAKGTSEKKVENAIRMGIALVYFVLPFQFDKLFGFNASLLAIFLEVILLLVYEYYLKQIKGARKAIKV